MVGAAVLALAGTVAGCSSDSGSEEEPIGGVETGSTDSATATDGTGDDQAADIAELEQLYQDYWDAWTELENTKELDFSLLDGIATETLVQQDGPRLQQFRDDGIHRRGAPTISDVTVSVTGDTARIESCKSEADWQVVQNGEVVPEAVPDALRAPHPFLMAAERSAHGWLISRTLPQEEATITCE